MFRRNFVNKQQSIERLILGRWGNVTAGGQVSKLSLDLIFSHILRITLVMEEDRAPNPTYINLLSQKLLMLQLQGTRGCTKGDKVPLFRCGPEPRLRCFAQVWFFLTVLAMDMVASIYGQGQPTINEYFREMSEISNA